MGDGLRRGEHDEPRDSQKESACVDSRPQHGRQRAEEVNAEWSGDVIHSLVGDPAMWVKELWACCSRMRIREKDRVVEEMDIEE